MSTQTGLYCVEKNYTYQHIIGDMLIQLNKLSFDLKLTHSEFRVMASIIGLFNKSYGKAFPTIDYLAKTCSMSKATIIKALKRLTEVNLIEIDKKPGLRNNYYIGNKLLSGIQIIPCGSTPCKTTHDKNKQNKTNRIIHNNNIINDDNSKNTTDLREYREVISKLESWSYSGSKQAIKCHGIGKIKSLIEFIETKNPDNKGAYLRTLLTVSGDNVPEIKNTCLKTDFNEAILAINQVKEINEPRLSKEEIISKLKQEGKKEEVQSLIKLWKLN